MAEPSLKSMLFRLTVLFMSFSNNLMPVVYMGVLKMNIYNRNCE